MKEQAMGPLARLKHQYMKALTLLDLLVGLEEESEVRATFKRVHLPENVLYGPKSDWDVRDKTGECELNVVETLHDL